MEPPASFTIALSSGPEAERFNDAFYRFLEVRCRSLDEFEERSGMLLSTPLGEREEKLVSFWSQDALDDFIRFWRARSAAPRALRPRVERLAD